MRHSARYHISIAFGWQLPTGQREADCPGYGVQAGVTSPLGPASMADDLRTSLLGA
jgi:hypothetical protein